jgi:hypothetical protein
MAKAVSYRTLRWRSGFDVYVRFVVCKANLGRGVLPVLRFPLSALYYRRSIPIFSLELILSEQQEDKVSESPNNATLLCDFRLPPRSS